MTSLVTATFKTRAAAENTLRRLETIGVTDEQISLVVTDETRGNSFAVEESSKVDEGVASGAAAGGLVGALLGTMVTGTAIAIPGLNIVVAGAIVASLAGLGAGATAGGLVGGLIGAGIPEHEAKIYENEIKDGGILLAVKPEDDDQKEQVADIFERGDAHNLAA